MENRKRMKLTEGGISRRTLLKAGLVAGLGLTLPARALASLATPHPPEKILSLYNIHTGESIRRAVYRVEGSLVPETVQELNYLLRDFRTDEVVDIEPELFDLLYTLRQKLGSQEAFHVISGYRSPATNALLARTTSGVASHSLHMDGKAIDIRLPGVALDDVRRTARALKRGGVGYYPDSNFVHVDTGRVRFW